MTTVSLDRTRLADTVARYGPWLVALAAVIAYANSLANGFAYDDTPIVAENARVHDLSNLRAIWLTPYWPNAGTILGLYRPLTIFGFALQWAISDGAPWFFHLGNVVLHAAVAVLGYLVLAQLASRVAALFGAIVFAVHPVHTEAVANVVGQSELIAALFVLIACLIWLRRPEGTLSAGRTPLLGLMYALGMLAKEHAIVLPGLLVALDLATGRVMTPAERPSRARVVVWLRHLLRPFAWLLLVAVAYLSLRLHILGSIAGTDPGPSLPYLREEARIFTAFRAWPEFARLLLWPADLSADYSPGVVLPAMSFGPMVALGLLLCLGTAALALLTPRVPAAGLPAAWFLVSILPASNLFFPIGVLLAERTLYLPSFAVALAAAFLWDAALRDADRRHRVVLGVLAAAAVAAMTVRTVVRNPDWKDLDTVMIAMLRDRPESYRAQWSAGVRAYEANDLATAQEHWALAYALWPRDPQLLIELAAFHLSQRRPGPAADLLVTAHRLAPDVPRATMLLPAALLQAGRPAEARAALADAYRVAGPDTRLMEVQAYVDATLGDHDRAAGAWRAVIRRLGGGNAEQWRLLSISLANAGRAEAAAAALDTAEVRLRAHRDPTASGRGTALPQSLPVEVVADSLAATRARLGL